MHSLDGRHIPDYQDLTVFVTVAKHRSISDAAKELYMSQQALSKTLQRIEAELGTVLFTRSRRGTDLTEVGKKLLPVARAVIKQLDFFTEVIDDITGAKDNAVLVVFEHAYMRFAVPSELFSRQAGIVLDSTVANGIQDCVDRVARNPSSVGFCSCPQDLCGLSYMSVVSEPLQFLMNTRNRLAKKDFLTMDDLRSFDHVLPLGDVAIIDAYIRECLKEGFYPNFTYESYDFNLLVRNVQANNVVQPTASFALTESSDEDLVVRPLKHEGLQAEYGFIYSEEGLTLPARSFMNAVLASYNRDQVF